jgi:hypothetical protein
MNEMRRTSEWVQIKIELLEIGGDKADLTKN